jgi:hypothetical protein
MKEFIVKGVAWQKRVKIDDSIFEKYEDMAFEAMTQSLECFLEGDYEITSEVDFPSLPWFLVASEAKHEKNPDKTIVCLTEFVLANAGEQKLAKEAENARKEIQKEQENNNNIDK